MHDFTTEDFLLLQSGELEPQRERLLQDALASDTVLMDSYEKVEQQCHVIADFELEAPSRLLDYILLELSQKELLSA